MSMTPGFGKLQTPRDLLDKLRHDYRRMERDPLDQYAAFDFFATAESAVDWLLPGKANRVQREQFRQANILIEITSHIASGAKHFKAEASHHRSVQHVDAAPSAFDPNAFDGDAFQTGELEVTLEGPAASALGPSTRALVLAQKVLAFWESQLAPPDAHL